MASLSEVEQLVLLAFRVSGFFSTPPNKTSPEIMVAFGEACIQKMKMCLLKILLRY